MKKIVSTLLICVLLVGALFSLAACGEKTLSGKYENKVEIAGVTVSRTVYEFDKDKNVSITYTVGVEFTIRGTYSITEGDDGVTTITFTFPAGQEGAEDFKGEHILVEGSEGDVDYIKIDGVQYKKGK